MSAVRSFVGSTDRPAFAESPPARAPRHSVVWLVGDLDLATLAELSESFAEVIAFDDADVVADLSGVTFIGVETVGVLVRSRQRLFLRSRTLEFRCPSPAARRLLELCGVELIDDHRPIGACCRA